MKNQLKINRFLKNNSPTILTVVGSIGVVVTAVMSARDTLKAKKRIDYERDYQDKEFDAKEKIKIAAPCYVPTIISGVSTVLCIYGANKLSRNVQKSLTSAYMLLDQSYKEYRKSVKEVYGEDGEKEVVKNVSSRQAEKSNEIDLNSTNTFFDFFSLQFFESDLQTILDAEKAANELLQKYGYVSLKTVYSLINEEILETDDLLGWSLSAGREYGYDHIEITVIQNTTEDGSKYNIIDFANGPTEDYLSYM